MDRQVDGRDRAEVTRLSVQSLLFQQLLRRERWKTVRKSRRQEWRVSMCTSNVCYPSSTEQKPNGVIKEKHIVSREELI